MGYMKIEDIRIEKVDGNSPYLNEQIRYAGNCSWVSALS